MIYGDRFGRILYGVPSVTGQISCLVLVEKAGQVNRFFGRLAQGDDSTTVFLHHNLPGGLWDVESGGESLWRSAVVQFKHRKLFSDVSLFVTDDVTDGRRISVVICDPVGENLSSCEVKLVDGCSSAHGHSRSLSPAGR